MMLDMSGCKSFQKICIKVKCMKQWIHKGENCQSWNTNGHGDLSLSSGIVPSVCIQNSPASFQHTVLFSSLS